MAIAPSNVTYSSGTTIGSLWLNGINDHANNLWTPAHPASGISTVATGLQPQTNAQAAIDGLATSISTLAPLASPTFTGTPAAPTPAYGDDDNSIATTAFVQAAAVQKTSATGSAKLPSGTTGQRDGSPSTGAVRFSTTLGAWEGWTGSTWVTLNADLTTLPMTFRNVLMNGDFRINQRAYASGAVLGSGSYAHDRWKAGTSGGDYSFTQLANSTQITIASSKSLIQVVEDTNVAGGTYVLSWTGTAQGRYGLNSATPSGSYAASPIIISGQTAGTTMSVEFNTGTLSKVQLEQGSIPSAFETRSYPVELMMCSRYYEHSNGSVMFQFPCPNTGGYASTFILPFTVPKRIAPTYVNATGTAVGYFSINYTSGVNLSSINLSVIRSTFCVIQAIGINASNTGFNGTWNCDTEL